MDAYYYSGGRRVELESDTEHVGIDRARAARAGMDQAIAAATPQMSRQHKEVVLTRRSELGEQTLARLQEAGALQAVYRHGPAVVMPLPEIRVEFDTPAQRQAVKRVLAGSEVPHAISEETDDWIVVCPASDRGDDALRLANEIYEHARPAAASVRMIQLVPKPLVRT